MASADFIPTGRTSLVKHGTTELQIQTEYAWRPAPRITTTVLRSGQVVQKIEHNLARPIDSLEEKDRVEASIRKQHVEVVDIIQRGSQRIAIPPEILQEKPRAKQPEAKPYPKPINLGPVMEQLSKLPGKHRVFRLDNDGNFPDAALSKEFRKMYKSVFKNLHELISVFAEVPGIGFTREAGVVEVERDALYLISSGTEFYILCIIRPDYSIEYEKEIRALLKLP
jgi:hypothetical protein